MKQEKLKQLCLAAVFTAVVFVFTAYLHIPSHTGYTHVGDAFIYLASALLPTPYAVLAGVTGALLADCLTGFALWAPASVVIKAAAIFFFTAKKKTILTPRNLLALLPASALCIGGYYLYEGLITGNFIAPAAGIPGYVTQSLLSSALFVALGSALDKTGLKGHLINGGNKL